MPHTHGEFVLKTNRGKALPLVVFALAPLVMVIITIGVKTSAAVAWSMAACLAAALVIPFAHMWVSRTVVTEYEIVSRGLFRHRRVPRSQAVRVVRVTIHQPHARAFDMVYVLDAHGRKLTAFADGVNTTEELDRMVEVLGLPCERIEGRRTYTELTRTHAHMLSWAERNPKGLLLIVYGVLVLVLAVFILVMSTLDALGYL